MMTVSWTRDRDDFVDSAAINREVQEAVRDAQADARAAQAEARAAVRVALRSLPRVDCGSSHAVRVRDDDNPAIRCVGWSEKDKAQLRRTMITSLERARASIAAMDMRHMTEDARDSALESLDQQLEYLRDHE
jgi:hypothetical protein